MRLYYLYCHCWKLWLWFDIMWHQCSIGSCWPADLSWLEWHKSLSTLPKQTHIQYLCWFACLFTVDHLVEIFVHSYLCKTILKIKLHGYYAYTNQRWLPCRTKKYLEAVPFFLGLGFCACWPVDSGGVFRPSFSDGAFEKPAEVAAPPLTVSPGTEISGRYPWISNIATGPYFPKECITT